MTIKWLKETFFHGDLDKLLRPWLLFSLGFHLLAILFSEGHHKLDEYDGILINTGYLLGYFDHSMLSTNETFHQIRPWLQPYLYAGLLWPFHALGFENPFFQNFVIRLFSSLLAYLALWGMIKHIPKFISDKRGQVVSLIAFCSLWFLPYHHARGSSENLSASFFLFAIILLLNKLPSEELFPKELRVNIQSKSLSLPLSYSLGIGVLLGLSFIFRFQMSVMVFFLCLWILLFSSIRLRDLAIISLAVFSSMGANLIVDYFGYGDWTFTPWNYWDFNINQGVADSYGVDPWYFFFTKTLVKGIPPISLFFIAPYFYLWIKKPLHLLTWLSLPFLVVHSMIGHKELRFMFALAWFLPVTIAFFEQKYSIFQRYAKTTIFFLLVNFVALIISSVKPAYSAIGLYHALYRGKVQDLYIRGDLPKELHYYLPFRKLNRLKYSDRPRQSKHWAFTNKVHLADDLFQNQSCRQIYQSYPNWLLRLTPKKIRNRSKVFFLFKCLP
jgi:phosphatidylinositol glycan class B